MPAQRLWRHTIRIMVAVLLMATAAVGQRPAVRPPNGPPPPVDLHRHSVPLDQIVFDTFTGSSVPLSQATASTIDRLRDAIRPIYQPRYDDANGGDWLRPTDLIIGYVGKTTAYAYPVNMLNFHEIVNDIIDGTPLMITYCPLCASGAVYDRRLDGQELVFGNTSALFENDMVMFDHQTGSYWMQVAGKAIVGTLSGQWLTLLPSTTMPWRQWRALYPQTRILARDQGFGRPYPYTRNPFRGYRRRVDAHQFPFPVSTEKIDPRLPASALMLTVRVGSDEKAYPLEVLGDAVVHDTIDGQPVVIFSSTQGPSGGAFLPQLAGRRLTFQWHKGQIRDQETGSRWNLLGQALAGPLQGQRLTALPTRRAFWFSLSLSIPNLMLYQPESR